MASAAADGVLDAHRRAPEASLQSWSRDVLAFRRLVLQLVQPCRPERSVNTVQLVARRCRGPCAPPSCSGRCSRRSAARLAQRVGDQLSLSDLAVLRVALKQAPQPRPTRDAGKRRVREAGDEVVASQPRVEAGWRRAPAAVLGERSASRPPGTATAATKRGSRCPVMRASCPSRNRFSSCGSQASAPATTIGRSRAVVASSTTWRVVADPRWRSYTGGDKERTRHGYYAGKPSRRAHTRWPPDPALAACAGSKASSRWRCRPASRPAPGLRRDRPRPSEPRDGAAARGRARRSAPRAQRACSSPPATRRSTERRDWTRPRWSTPARRSRRS